MVTNTFTLYVYYLVGLLHIIVTVLTVLLLKSAAYKCHKRLKIQYTFAVN